MANTCIGLNVVVKQTLKNKIEHLIFMRNSQLFEIVLGSTRIPNGLFNKIKICETTIVGAI